MGIKIFKTIFINIAVFLVMLMVLNIASVAIYQFNRLYKTSKLKIKGDLRAELPAYKDISWARQHFKELSQLKAEYRSYIGWRRLEFHGKTVNIDNDGIRFTPQSDLVSNDSKLVIFTGGSAMWGTGSDDANTIPAIFSKISSGKYRTMNFGESSYRTFQEYLFLRLKFYEGIRPDVIVSYSGANEIDGLLADLNPESHSRESQIKRLLKNYDHRGPELLSFRNILIGPLETFINRLKSRKLLYKYDLNNSRVEKVAKAFLNSWITMKHLADEKGAIFLAVLQPVATSTTLRQEHLEIDKNIIESYSCFYSMVLKLMKSTEYSELTDHFFDLSAFFNNDGNQFIDWCHTSSQGNEKVAKAIYDKILFLDGK